MALPRLGKLERVDLRQEWVSEPAEFTPWLASDEHIELLGKALGAEFEVVDREKNVGRFKADILCRDTRNDN